MTLFRKFNTELEKCFSMKRNRTLIIAHKGNFEAPENTIAAINQALDISVDYIEIDIRLSEDKIPVVFHDSFVIFNQDSIFCHLNNIEKLPYSQIQKIDVGFKFGERYAGEKIPRLLDVLHLRWGKIGLMIEIKDLDFSDLSPIEFNQNHPVEIVDAVFSEISMVRSPLPKLVIGSFSLEIFNEVSRRLHELKCDASAIGIIGPSPSRSGLWWRQGQRHRREVKKIIDCFMDAGAKKIAIWHKLIDAETMKIFKDNEIEVWAYTVDNMSLSHTLIHLGVSGLISNRPAKLKRMKIFV